MGKEVIVAFVGKENQKSMVGLYPADSLVSDEKGVYNEEIEETGEDILS